MRRKFRPTWLMIKVHNKTGLKYFCKTTKKDPVKYSGSGLYWKRHLKQHGNDVSTVWAQLFTDREVLTEYAMSFSIENNIVESVNDIGDKAWANLQPENGLDGALPGEDHWLFGKTHSDETKEILRSQSTGREHSQESKDKRSKKLSGPGNPMFGKSHTEESNKSRKLTLTDFWNNKRVNGESLDRPDVTKRLEISLLDGTHPSYSKVSCLCCRDEISLGMFYRWHGVKCRGPKEVEIKIHPTSVKWKCVCGISGTGSSNYSRWHSKCSLVLPQEIVNA